MSIELQELASHIIFKNLGELICSNVCPENDSQFMMRIHEEDVVENLELGTKYVNNFLPNQKKIKTSQELPNVCVSVFTRISIL